MTPEAEAKILQDLERELQSFEVIPIRTAPSPREQHFSTQPAHRPFTVRLGAAVLHWWLRANPGAIDSAGL